MKERIYCIIRYVLAMIMVGFALLQLNDPDSFVWMCAYLFVALASVLGTAEHNRWRITLGALYVCVAVWIFPKDYYGVGEMEAFHPEIEQARESLGVLIAGGICFVSSWLYRRS
jgi:hypothetical protein